MRVFASREDIREQPLFDEFGLQFVASLQRVEASGAERYLQRSAAVVCSMGGG